MIPFVLRELRRQAPVALGSLVLGLLVLVASQFFRLDRYGAESAAAMSVIAVLVVAPLLLGVASVAPDAESGAIAFLSHLPRSPRRELFLRWTVAIGLSLAATGADFLVASSWAGNVPIDVFKLEQVPMWLLAVLAFAVGCASSVAFRQTITALVFAPVFALPVFALKAEGDALAGWHSEAGILLVGCGAGVALLGAAIGFLRGDLHRASWRPVKLVVGGLLAGSALLSGSAYALDQVPWSWEWRSTPTLRDARNEHALFVGYRVIGLGGHTENRYVVLDLKSGKTVELGDMWHAIALSPDGAKLLALASSGGRGCLRLIDIATKKQEDRALEDGSLAPYQDSASASHLLVAGTSQGTMPVAWRGGEPVLSRRGVLEAWSGKAPTFGGKVESLGGSRVLVCSSNGERLVFDLEQKTPLTTGLYSVPSDRRIASAKLSPAGDWVAASVERSGSEPCVFLAAVGDDRCYEVPTGRNDSSTHWQWVHFAGDRMTVDSSTEGWTGMWIVDARTGTREKHVGSVELSPRGSRLRSETEGPRHIAGFLDEDRAVLSGVWREVWVRDLATGKESLLLR